MAGRLARAAGHPARLLPGAFVVVIALGTLLLLLPPARAGPGAADLLTAFFTATSAVCVTGLTVVDTGTYFSPTGQAIIMLLILVGGFGITALATLVVLAVAGRLGLHTRLAAQRETKTLALADIGRVLTRVALTMLVLQAVVAVVLSVRLLVAYDEPAGTAIWDGVFHAVSASNNAGFSLYPDSLARFVADPVVVGTVCLAIVIGGIGFPVLLELSRDWRRPGRLSLHSRLTLGATAVLLLVGALALVLFEWSNPGTIGGLEGSGKVLATVFHSVQPRTAGFSTIDVTELRQESLLLTVLLMFIGGGSAGTAGGIKVTTAAVLLFVVWAEIRGDDDVTVARWRIAPSTQRQAVGIAAMGLISVVVGAIAIMGTTQIEFGPAVFEATSAVGTVGLSLGFDAELPAAAKLTLAALMFIGRVGPVAAFSFLALRTIPSRFRYPETRPLVG